MFLPFSFFLFRLLNVNPVTFCFEIVRAWLLWIADPKLHNVIRASQNNSTVFANVGILAVAGSMNLAYAINYIQLD